MFRRPRDPRGWPMPPNPSPVPRAGRVAAASPALSGFAPDGYRRRVPSQTRGLLRGAAAPSAAAAVAVGVSPALRILAAVGWSPPPDPPAPAGPGPAGWFPE